MSLDNLRLTQQLAARGYGWEDTCVKLGVWRHSDDGREVRRIVLRL